MLNGAEERKMRGREDSERSLKIKLGASQYTIYTFLTKATSSHQELLQVVELKPKQEGEK